MVVVVGSKHGSIGMYGRLPDCKVIVAQALGYLQVCIRPVHVAFPATGPDGIHRSAPKYFFVRPKIAFKNLLFGRTF